MNLALPGVGLTALLLNIPVAHMSSPQSKAVSSILSGLGNVLVIVLILRAHQLLVCHFALDSVVPRRCFAWTSCLLFRMHADLCRCSNLSLSKCCATDETQTELVLRDKQRGVGFRRSFTMVPLGTVIKLGGAITVIAEQCKHIVVQMK